MSRAHTYSLSLEWTGNRGTGTSGYRDYSRDHVVAHATAPPIAGSSDPAFRGDRSRWNPEQLLVASLSQCHMLWYLHLAGTAGVVVTEYRDDATGTMTEEATGAGRFSEVVLRPRVVVSPDSDLALAERLHGRVGDYCFIARSVNFPVRHIPVVTPGAPIPSYP